MLCLLCKIHRKVLKSWSIRKFKHMIKSYIQHKFWWRWAWNASLYSIKHPVSEMKVVVIVVVWYERCLALRKNQYHVMQRSFFFPISISIFLLCIQNNEQLKTRAYLALCIETLRMIESVLELWHFQRSVHYERGNMLFRVVDLHKICQFYLDI